MPAVETVGLKKRFGDTEALRGVDLAVERATVLGVLGPNGAGKTTAVRILTTLLKPDAGSAFIDGIDVVDGSAPGTGADRPHRSVRRGRRAPHRVREPRARRPAVPPARHATRARAPASCSSASSSSMPPTGWCKHVLGRHASSARHRDEPDRPTRRCSSSTSRPPGSTRAAASRCGTSSTSSSHSGDDDAAHHAVPRRGRPPRRRDRGHRPRRGDRARHRRRAQAPGRRRADRGPARRVRPTRRGSSRCSRRSRAATPDVDDDGRTRRGAGARACRASCPIVVRELDDGRHRRARTSGCAAPTLDDVFFALTGRAGRRTTTTTRPTQRATTTDGREGAVMSAATATTERAVEEIPDPPSGPSWLLRDSWTEATRHLRALPRNPELLVFATLQPIMFVVLFVYVFGGSIDVPGYCELQAVRDPRDLRPDRAVRLDLHRPRHRRGPEQGLHRPAALAADVPVGRALRSHDERRRAQRALVRGDARRRVRWSASASRARSPRPSPRRSCCSCFAYAFSWIQALHRARRWVRPRR